MSLTLTTGELTIDGTMRGGSVDVNTASALISGEIDAGGSGPTATGGTSPGISTCWGDGAGGAGHAGFGAGCGGGSTGASESYGDAIAPFDFGSGGGNQAQYGTIGGSGGGRVRITSTGPLNVDGLINARGTNGSGSTSAYGGGGGSGGSIHLIAGALSGLGILDVRGGAGSVVNGGGGSGGRIALDYDTSSATLSTEATGGCNAASSGCTSSYGAAGTLYDANTETLTIDAGGTSPLATHLPTTPLKHLALLGNARAEVRADLSVSESIFVDAGSTLQTTLEGAAWTLTAGAVTIAGLFEVNDDLTATSTSFEVTSGGSVNGTGMVEFTLTTGALTVDGTMSGSTLDISAESAVVNGTRALTAGLWPGLRPWGRRLLQQRHRRWRRQLRRTGRRCGGTSTYGDPLLPFEHGSGGANHAGYGTTGDTAVVASASSSTQTSC